MTGTSTPSLRKALVRMHAVLTRSLEMLRSRSQSFMQQGLSDSSLRTGFVSYARSFVSVLHAHHLFENDIAFPYFRDKIPEAPFELLTAQHREMAPLLDDMKAAADDVENKRGGVEPLARINTIANWLATIWYPHIKGEESNFTSQRIAATITPDEDLRLTKVSAEHSRQHSGPDYLVVPFILYNLPSEDRAAIAAEMPPVVTQQLVPVIWKEKWAPMTPVLLS